MANGRRLEVVAGTHIAHRSSMERHLLPRWARVATVAGLLPAAVGCASGAAHLENETRRSAVPAGGSRSIAGPPGNATTTRSVDPVSHADHPASVSSAP